MLRRSDLRVRFVRALTDLVFSPQCALCGDATGSDPLVCDGCQGELDIEMARPACPRCGHSIGPFGATEAGCQSCHARRLRLDGLVRSGPYEAKTAELVRQCKYDRREELLPVMARRVAAVLETTQWWAAVDGIVHVPSHWAHAAGRSCYVPRALAGLVSREANVFEALVLKRVAGGPHQFDVPRSEREANIRGKFALAAGSSVSGARICLIDDVSTTGATLNECAGVLKGAGAAAVYGAVVAKVDTEVCRELPDV